MITVTFGPDLAVLGRQLHALPADAVKVVVDNASPEAIRAELRELCATIGNTHLLENAVNLGLPAAINLGARFALGLRPQPGYLLLLDQDTEPGEEGATSLLAAYLGLIAQGLRPGCVGPRLLDARTGMEHGFHQIAGWRWVRLSPLPSSGPLQCVSLNCSGTLMSAEVFEKLGGLDEALFLDHLDTEWSFRVRAAGYGLYGVPAVGFSHRMGEKTWRIWLGKWRIWPYRTAGRHYFLFRNCLWLMRRDYVPGVWKFWAAIKLLTTMLVHAVADPERGAQLAGMCRGLLHGLREQGRAGRSS